MSHNSLSESGVQLDDLDPILSASDQDLPSNILSEMETETYDEDSWLSQYVFAHAFVHPFSCKLNEAQ